MAKKEEAGVKQAGVIPYRMRGGQVEVLLVTSRTRGRWIVPKGNIEAPLSARESARQEAYEEAGVAGRVAPTVLGIYAHGGAPAERVAVFLMAVEQELPAWPEAAQRTRQWMPLEAARDAVDEEELKEILSTAAEHLRRRHAGAFRHAA